MAAVDTITPPHDVVVLKSVEYPAFNREVHVNNWSDLQRAGRSGIHEVKGRPQPIAVTDLMQSREFDLTLVTHDDEQHRVMDLLLAQGGVLLLHVPHGSPVPGGYILARDVSRGRYTRTTTVQRRRWDLSCRVVAAPDADVQTALVTWHTLEAAYGSWEAVWAAHSSWLDLWASVEDPGEILPL